MRTRDVFRWNMSPRDLVLAAGIALAGALIVVMDAATMRLERWIDGTDG
jgi:hypothetical protein